jgi:type IV secretion system protein TrbL
MTSHLLIMAVSGAAAASAAPTFSDHLLLNDVLLRIVEAVMVYYPTLVLIMSGLLAGLAVLHLAMPAIHSIGRGNLTSLLPDFAITLLRIGLLLVCMDNVADWGNDIIDGMQQVASNVTGASPATITPSGVFNAGLGLYSTLEDAYGTGGWWHPILTIEHAVLLTIIFLAFFAAAVIYLLTLIAARWVIYTGPIWIALAALEQTYDSFIQWGVKLIGLGVYVLLQIMVIAVGLTLVQSWSAELTNNAAAITSNLYWLLRSLAEAAVFCWMVAYIPNYMLSLVGHSLIGGEFGHELASGTPSGVLHAAASTLKGAGRAGASAARSISEGSHHRSIKTFKN